MHTALWTECSATIGSALPKRKWTGSMKHANQWVTDKLRASGAGSG